MATLLDIVKKGSTDRSVTIRIIDSTNGTPETGVVWNTAGIDLWYRREGEAKTSITEATLAALTTAHTDGGFLHISDGEYRLDLPDAAFATGANHVEVGGIVTGMVIIGGRVRLVNYDPEDTVRLGLTALPNAAADAAGGLPISDAGALDLDVQFAKLDTIDNFLDTEIAAILAAVDTEVAAILVDTAEIGAAGAGLTAIPWNAAWDAEVQSEVNDGMVALHLDHLISASGTVDNALADATTTIFKTDLTAVNDTYNDQVLIFTSGALAGQSKPILDYAQTNGVITLSEELTAAPSNGVTFVIKTDHVHPVSQIQSGLSTLDAAGVRTAVGLAAANLDTQLAAIDDFLDTEVAAILAAVDTEVAAILVDTGTDIPATLAALFTTALTEAYRGTGATGTVAQLLYEIIGHLGDHANAGTTRTLKKLDGTTTSKTFTYDSSSAPTSITEST